MRDSPATKTPGHKTQTSKTEQNSTAAKKRKTRDENEPEPDSEDLDNTISKKKQKQAKKSPKTLADSSSANEGSGGEAALSALGGDGASLNQRDMAAEFAAMKAALKEAERKNTQLQQQLSQAVPQDSNENRGVDDIIEKPSGSKWSIQVEMRLKGAGRKYDNYKAIQRSVRDLAMAAHINWEVPWRDVPSSQKAMLFDVCRQRHPYLARFRNDWATEAIVKQFLGNKRQRAYDMGWLKVPEKYTYLKSNASKRSSTGSRKKKGLQSGPTSRTTSGKASGSSKRGKGKASAREEDEGEDEVLRFKQTSDEDSSGEEEADNESE
ncbi:hypothetical protein HWV62_25830 [Athelia sp. TMB]|nr:hypothetical protein HWV62_25830 [Athelia sp. TMB]